MKAEEQKILNEFLSKTLKIDEEQLATLYDEAGDLTGLQIAFDADAARVKRSGEERKNQFDRGLKEGASKIEKEIKSKYEVESELQGVELVDSIVLSKVEEASKGSKDISKHPEMIKARAEWEKEQKTRDKAWEEKLNAKDAEFAKTKLNEKIRSRALILLDEFKAILPEDPRKAATWKETYVNDLLSNNYQETKDDFVVLDKDGGQMKDAHGYNRKFKEFAKEIADKYFEYPVADSRNSSGNKPPDKNNTGGDFTPPKDQKEYEERLRNPNITPKERIALVNWGETNLK